MTDSDIVDIEHLAPLDSDNIPNANQSHFCLSCETPLSGLHCAACGQKNDDMRRSIFVLVVEFFASITALESRIWRTWSTLFFKPGKVAREFANGRRSHWSSPVRVYLAMSLILFGFMNITQTHLFSLDVNVKPREGVIKPREDLIAKDLTFDVSTHFFETQKMIDRRNLDLDFDLLDIKLKESKNFYLNIGPKSKEDAREGEDEDDLESDSASSREAILNTIESELEDVPLTDEQRNDLKKAGKITVNGKEITRENAQAFLVNFIKKPAIVTQIFNTWLPRIMFIMMPFTMLIGAVFIRGRGNALLYDHLVHAAYIHAVAFFFIFVGIILVRIVPDLKVASSIFLMLAIYLPISLKHMFNRSWRKTIWTSYGVATIYIISIIFILLWLTAYSLQTNFA